MVRLSDDEKMRIIKNAQAQAEQIMDPLEREHLKGFICGIWCCMDD